MGSNAYFGLEFLSSPVLLLDAKLRLVYANPMAEQLFELSLRNAAGLSLTQIFAETDDLATIAASALQQQSGFLDHALMLKGLHGQSFQLSCTVTPVEAGEAALLLEFQQLNHKLRIAREERIHNEQQQNRQLIRSLAHEIRNPLGGIKGAAQLLERELEPRNLHEYTQVIVKEVDRLQTLIDRLLAPQRIPLAGPVNIHEVLERVRSLILAENGSGITIERDYDLSLPELTGDREQLIQAVLNISRNAAQAMAGKGLITLRTRVARQVTLHKRRYRLAILLQIVDNGPGIAPELGDKILHRSSPDAKTATASASCSRKTT